VGVGAKRVGGYLRGGRGNRGVKADDAKGEMQDCRGCKIVGRNARVSGLVLAMVGYWLSSAGSCAGVDEEVGSEQEGSREEREHTMHAWDAVTRVRGKHLWQSFTGYYTAAMMAKRENTPSSLQTHDSLECFIGFFPLVGPCTDHEPVSCIWDVVKYGFILRSIIIAFNQPSGLINFTNFMERVLFSFSMGFAPGSNYG
jgi:hypothetical protein